MIRRFQPGQDGGVRPSAPTTNRQAPQAAIEDKEVENAT